MVRTFCKVGTGMKVGDVVRFKDQGYRVGLCRTDTSIELVELENGSRGLWVSRTEVHALPLGLGQSDQRQYVF